MSELIKSYDNAAGRTAQVRYDTAHYPRPFWVEARAAAASSFGVASRGVKMLCGTYRTQEEAEHAAAHFMATGDLPAAAEGSRLRAEGATPRQAGVASPKPKTAQKPREGVDGVPGAVSTHAAPETHFATPLQRQGGAN